MSSTRLIEKLKRRVKKLNRYLLVKFIEIKLFLEVIVSQTDDMFLNSLFVFIDHTDTGQYISCFSSTFIFTHISVVFPESQNNKYRTFSLSLLKSILIFSQEIRFKRDQFVFILAVDSTGKPPFYGIQLFFTFSFLSPQVTCPCMDLMAKIMYLLI